LKGKTCSRACLGKLLSEVLTGTHMGRTSKPRHCEICEAPFWPRNLTPARRYCSRRCYGIWRSTDLGIRVHMKAIAPLGIAARTPESFVRAAEKMTGPLNPAWKGGVRWENQRNRPVLMVRCPSDLRVMAQQNGYVFEHRLIVARAIGRPLTRLEVVHHVDHDPSNNAVGNLMLFATQSEHKLFEARGLPLPLWSGASTPDTCGASPCRPGRLLLDPTACRPS
jgi:hypothetical protein